MLVIQIAIAAAVIGVGIYRRSLTVWIFAAMALGALVGVVRPGIGLKCQVLGAIFLRLIKVIIAPLLFGTLVSGIGGHGDVKKAGRVGMKALIYFEVVSTVALILGFVAINLSHAGYGLHIPLPAGSPTTVVIHAWNETLLAMFPENIAKSVADGETLQIVVFCVLFGVAVAALPEPQRKIMVQFSSAVADTMFRFTSILMYAAPVGVFGAMAYAVAHVGLGVFLPLVHLVITMYVALLSFALLVLLPVAWLARIPVMPFLRKLAEPLAIAFGTSSSEAALPIAMERLEEMGISRETLSLVLPLGYSFNQAGSGIYQSLALVFLAQASGIHLTVGQQGFILLTLLISNKGTAGVARGALVVVLAVASSLHLPTEMVVVLFGIDQIMDMGRTVINVLGNCLATAAVARWEGETGLFRNTRSLGGL